MSIPLQQIFIELAPAAKAAQEQKDSYLIIDPIYQHMEALQAAPFDALLPLILQLVETYPEADYGGPGPFGSLIEEQPMARYTPALAASLQRQPSTQVIGWLDRTTQVDDDMRQRDPNPVGNVELADLLRQVLAHPAASLECREFAQICLNDL